MPVFYRLALLALCTTTTALGAQDKSAVFAGTVVLRDSGTPVKGALILYLATARADTTDSLGRFEIRDLPAGINKFLVSAPGVPRSTLVLPFAPGERLERTLEVELAGAPVVGEAPSPAAQPIAGVAVTAPAPLDRRFGDFERRQRTGRGQYITRKTIEDGGYYSLQDAMRNLRGVKVDCGGGAGCFITMARAPMGCIPEYIVDEMVSNSFGAQTPVRDIEAVEVYTGASDVPGEFAGRNAACGLVIIWTKNGPPRAKKKPAL
jgi:hypothetical protein